ILLTARGKFGQALAGRTALHQCGGGQRRRAGRQGTVHRLALAVRRIPRNPGYFSESRATQLRKGQLTWSSSSAAMLASVVLVGPVGAAIVGACTALGLRRGPHL